jgi:chemotaxis protein methyltransferase WspC
MQSALDQIIEVLRQRIGLNAASIGRAAIEHAVRTRLSSAKLTSVEDYWKYLEASPEELQALIEVVVVPETWFFRHPEVFEALTDFVMNEWLAKNTTGLLHVLSIPCSTGEEPYSIAMALLDAGFPTNRLAIDAMDVSARALQYAKTASYREYSFRGKSLRFREQYFVQDADGYRLKDSVRRLVNFQQHNILELSQLDNRRYDVIFCRNLLIYLERAQQDAVVASLAQCLHEDGRLFGSPAEHSLFSRGSFQSVQLLATSAFQKADFKKREWPQAPSKYFDSTITSAKADKPTPKPVSSQTFISASTALLQPEESTTAHDAAADDVLNQVAALADAGKLEEATRLCDRYVQTSGGSVRAFYLQALLKDAAGHLIEAESLYRKVIYMNPNHVEALLHLASLRAMSGDNIQAQQLRERARRVQERVQENK